MTKKTSTRMLSGAAQDAYFRRVLKSHPALSAEERDRIVRRLRLEVSQLRLRATATEDAAPAVQAPPTAGGEPPSIPEGPPSTVPFDPFLPNVVVMLRTSGREGALAALAAIENVQDLRLLAREQRLSIAAALGSASEIRAAIVAAAERRIANRLAAASS
jgi:hypothetical protein